MDLLDASLGKLLLRISFTPDRRKPCAVQVIHQTDWQDFDHASTYVPPVQIIQLQVTRVYAG